MIIEIPDGTTSMTLPNGMKIEIPKGTKSMEVPEDILIPQTNNPIAKTSKSTNIDNVKNTIIKNPQTGDAGYNNLGVVHDAPNLQESKTWNKKDQLENDIGRLQKGIDELVTLPVSNAFNKFKQWWDKDETINHQTKIDNDFRHNVSALSNPQDSTLVGTVGEWANIESLKQLGKRKYETSDIEDFRQNVAKVAGDKYDVKFDDKTGEVYAKPKGSSYEFEKVLNNIGDSSWDEIETRIKANLVQVGTELGLDIGAGIAFDRKYGKNIKHPALRFMADGLVAVASAPVSAGIGTVAQTAYSGENISTQRLIEKAKEEAIDNTFATATALGAIGILTGTVKGAINSSPFHTLEGGKNKYKETALYEVPEESIFNSTKTKKEREEKLSLIAKQKAEAEDIFSDFGGIKDQAEVIEMASQSNTKEILGNHFNHSQERVNAEIKNSIALTKNFKNKFNLDDNTSADLYRFMRGGMLRVKRFYQNYYRQAQDLILKEMGDDLINVSSQTQSKLNELIDKAKHPYNVENTRLQEAQRTEFNKDYQDLLELTKRDFTQDVPIYNEKKDTFEYIPVDTKGYTVKGLFEVQKKFNAFTNKHKDKFTKPQLEELDTIKEAIYKDIYRAIENKDFPDELKKEVKDLWADANRQYSHYKKLMTRSDVLSKLVEDDTPFDVAKFANDVFKNINKRDADDFDIVYTFGKELKRTGGDLDKFYTSIIDGLIKGAGDIKAPTGEISQGVMKTIKHQNQTLEVMDFDAFHKSFNQIDKTTLNKIFGLTPRGQELLTQLKKFDELASREAVLQQTLLNKEFKMSETAMRQHDIGKLFYSTIYGTKALMWDWYAKYFMRSKAYDDFFLKAITKQRYEDIEPLLKKLDYEQRNISPMQRVDISSLKADLQAYKKAQEQTIQAINKFEESTGREATREEIEQITIDGLIEYKPQKDISVRDFDIEKIQAKKLAEAEGMDDIRIARINSFDDLTREIKDFKMEINEITMAHRKNPPPKNSNALLKDNIEESKKEEYETSHKYDEDLPKEQNSDLVQKALNSTTTIPRDVEKALKIPKIKFNKWLKPNQISASGMYQQKEQSLRALKPNLELEVGFSDSEFDKYYKLADSMMSTFQGAKKEMGTTVPQIVKSIFSNNELKQIDTINDYFGGGGSWGLFVAKTGLMPNIKEINIFEYSPARKQKIEFTHSHYKEMVDYLNSDEAYKVMKFILDSEQASGNVGSGYGIQKQIIEDLLKNAKNYDEVKQSALIALADYTTLSRGKKTDPTQALKQMIEQLQGIGKAVDDLKAKGIKINYQQADSYSLEHQEGSNVLSMIDPPYLKTAGYSWIDLETGKLVKADNAVGMDIYTKTWKMINQLKAKGNSIIYTDEAYYKKPLYDNYVQEDKVIEEYGKNAYDMTIDIANQSDIFMEFPVDKRTETLSVIKSNKFKGETDGRINSATKELDSVNSNNGRNRIEQSGNRGDTKRTEHSQLDNGATEESRGTNKSDAGNDTNTESLIDYKIVAKELNQTPPSFEELKALELLENNLDFSKDVFIPLRNGKINEVGAKKYKEALDKHKEQLSAKIDEVKYPFTEDNIAKVNILRDYLKYEKNSGGSLGVGDVVNGQELKALIYDLKTNKKPRNEKYTKLYYDLQKAYEEFKPRIEELYRDMSFEEAEKAGLIPFAKGIDNLAVGAIAGIEEDENGNLTFDPEKFLIGLGGWQIAKMTAKHLNDKYNFTDESKKALAKFIQSGEEEMMKMAGGGVPPKNFIDNQGFYSVLEKTVDEKVGGKIDSVSLAKLLKNNGVKEDEIEWSGLKELMNNNEKLTKEQIEDTIKSNRLEIETISKTSEPKYKDWKLKGGDNYREILFKMPTKRDESIKILDGQDGYWYAEKAPYDGTNVIQSAKNKKQLEYDLYEKNGYKNKHWEEKNIMAFTRVDDRTIDNKKTLFAEEIQSDWHQDGRKKGYAKKGVPNAPFKKNWHEFTLKRLIQEAVANDYDKIAWTTGKQQADRYSLENTADTLVYNQEAGAVQATKGGKQIFFKSVASDEELEGFIGKEMAKKLLDKKNTTTNDIYVLSGEELRFGGEGMRAFYDEILPNSVKKLFKKYGVKPKMEELDDIEQMVWSVDITSQMKDDISKYGQPLYTVVGGAVVANETLGESNE